MLGITFIENCPDIRNTRAIDIYRELESYDMNVDVYDPWADPEEVQEEFGIELTNGGDLPDLGSFSAIILAVAHEEFRELPIRKSDDCVIYDVKGVLDKEVSGRRL
jgi:UDP-N-acetyl-D-galactosamine dehydrogenase